MKQTWSCGNMHKKSSKSEQDSFLAVPASAIEAVAT